MKKFFISILVVLGYLGGYLLLSTAVSSAVTFIGSIDLFFDPNLLTDPNSLMNAIAERAYSGYSIVFTLLITSIVFSIVVLLINRRSLGKDGWFTGFKKADLGFTLVFAVACAILVSFILGYIFPEFYNTMPADQQQIFASLSTVNPLLFLFTISIVAPFAEEILFRGAIYNALKRRIGGVAGVLISAILFGIFHGNLFQASYATILGLVMGLIIYKGGSILLPIIFHIVYNFLVSVPNMFPRDVMDFLFMRSFILPIIGLVLFNAALVYFLQRKRKEEIEIEEISV